jgi:hypothetical protein
MTHVIQVSIRKGEETPRTFTFNSGSRAERFLKKMRSEGFRVDIRDRLLLDVLRESFPEKFI